MNVRRWTWAFPIDLHWTTFCAIRCQCFTKLSKSSLHLVLGLPWFPVCPWGVQNVTRGCPTVFCSSRHMTRSIQFEFAYRFHNISYFNFFSNPLIVSANCQIRTETAPRADISDTRCFINENMSQLLLNLKWLLSMIYN